MIMTSSTTSFFLIICWAVICMIFKGRKGALEIDGRRNHTTCPSQVPTQRLPIELGMVDEHVSKKVPLMEDIKIGDYLQKLKRKDC
mmetsp:Transcript_11018/g.14391  ORF Transcript_11018/g.14391 Transcript_11018/m.14391 type:complete len:86 (-) Transcript_11018:197-454(-)